MEKLDLTNLKNSIETLKEAFEAYKQADEKYLGFIEDSCVKRFEYTNETSWKIMKKFLKSEYGKKDAELTMNNIFRFMEGYGFIPSWENWKNYYENRNSTSHEYNQNKAKELIKIIESFIEDSENLYKNLKKHMENK